MSRARPYTPIVSADKTATVANGQTATPEIDLNGEQLVGIFVPAEFDGTTITLTASPTSGGTFVTVQIGDGTGSTYTITTTASRYVPIGNLGVTAGIRFLKLVCGTAQTGATTFTLATRPV